MESESLGLLCLYILCTFLTNCLAWPHILTVWQRGRGEVSTWPGPCACFKCSVVETNGSATTWFAFIKGVKIVVWCWQIMKKPWCAKNGFHFGHKSPLPPCLSGHAVPLAPAGPALTSHAARRNDDPPLPQIMLSWQIPTTLRAAQNNTRKRILDVMNKNGKAIF